MRDIEKETERDQVKNERVIEKETPRDWVKNE